ncbi:MAG: hypothetical protein U1F98_06820 [Verrucomicrobiota bacterium]
MNAMVRKEIRLVLPAFVAAVVLVVAAMSFEYLRTARGAAGALDSWLYVQPLALLVGLGLLGVASFGREFSSGTLPILLAQPVARNRIWLLKIIVTLIPMSGLLLLHYGLLWWLRPAAPGRVLWLIWTGSTIVIFCTVSGGSWTVLLLRHVAASFFLTIGTTIAIGMTVSWICMTWLGSYSLQMVWIMQGALAVYAVLGLLFSRWLFLRAQDVEWSGGVISIPIRWPRFAPGWRMGRGPRTAWMHLIAKEVQFHQVSLLIAVVVFVLNIFIVGFRKVNPEWSDSSTFVSVFLGIWIILWFSLPVLLGSMAVAEERRLGTMEGQLCLPIPHPLQFVVKLGVVLVLSIILGAFIPFLVERLGVAIGARGGPFGGDLQWKDLKGLCLSAAAVSLVSFYASTLTRGTLSALAVSIFVGSAVALIGQLGGIHVFPNPGGPAIEFRLLAYFGIPALLLTIVEAAYGNSRHVLVNGGLWLRNILMFAICIAASVFLARLIYQRPWERLMSLEPGHKPPVLAGPLQSRICECGGTYFVLLPDGRLWKSGLSTALVPPGVKSGETYTPIAMPVEGSFLSGADWVDLVSTGGRVIALKSDGSLWRLAYDKYSNGSYFLVTVKDPEQIAVDSKWKAIAAGLSFVIAVRKDGTLWGAGDNSEGQLGRGTNWAAGTHFVRRGDLATDQWVQVGTNSDWVNIFAGYHASIGVKTDGSVWQWGMLCVVEDWGSAKQHSLQSAEPVRCAQANGYDLVDVVMVSTFQLQLKRNGALSVMGWLQNNVNVLGCFAGENGRVLTTPRRVGDRSTWKSVSGGGDTILAISSDGELVVNKVYGNFWFGLGALWKPSKYSDWLGTTRMGNFERNVISLAADGTLNCWEGDQRTMNDPDRLLCPSRKPIWSLNLFDTVQGKGHEKGNF